MNAPTVLTQSEVDAFYSSGIQKRRLEILLEMGEAVVVPDPVSSIPSYLREVGLA